MLVLVNFGCFSPSRFSHFHCNAMRKAIKACLSWHKNQQNEHTPGSVNHFLLKCSYFILITVNNKIFGLKNVPITRNFNLTQGRIQGRGRQEHASPLGPNSLIFMHFFPKFLQSNRFVHFPPGNPGSGSVN